MLRLLILVFTLLLVTQSYAQSISYGFSYGIPQITSSNDFLDLTYERNAEYTFAFGLNNTNTIADQTELRLTTYSSKFEILNGSNFGINTTTQNIRKYIIELQSYFTRLKLNKLGEIQFGSKLTYLMRSDVEGRNILPSGEIQIINSQEFDRGSKFKVFLLAKYVLGNIKLTESLRLQPSYTFNYSFNNDLADGFLRTRLITHAIQLSFVKDLDPKSPKTSKKRDRK